MYPIAVSVILLVGLTIFAHTAYRWMKVFLQARGDHERLQDIPGRIKFVLRHFLGQEKLLKLDPRAGFMHALIFWGFLVIAIRTITLFAVGFDADFVFPLMGGQLGKIYSFLLAVFELLVCWGVAFMLYRRLVLKPARLTYETEGTAILFVILGLMVTDFLLEGAQVAMNGGHEESWNFAAHWTGQAMLAMGLGPTALKSIFVSNYFIHIIAIIAFLNFLPYGKHFHVITALFNVFLLKRTPYGRLSMMDLEDENAESFGTGKTEDLTWKQMLDIVSCTHCGRCSSVCPAWATDKPLNPKLINEDLFHHMKKKYHMLPGFLADQTQPSDDDLGTDEKPLSPFVIENDVLWSCTSCRACENVCPVDIEFVDKIVDMRRHQVLTQGTFPEEVQATFKNMENQSNPWGISSDDRANWAEGLGVKTMAEHPDAEYLYYVGCAGSFDDRNKKIATAFVKILQLADIDFAILGKEEYCCGDPARRIGNEYLYQMLAQQNAEVMKNYKVQKILTACPHCFNTIKNEYPDFDAHFEVVHHTEFIAKLIKDGKVKPNKSLDETVTYHDSCYLGRYNDIYKAPREILESIPNLTLKEMELAEDMGRCCGAGGGRMWMEETLGTRVNHKRMDDALETGASTVASNCPFCVTMLNDAANDKEVADRVKTRDVAEILADAIE